MSTTPPPSGSRFNREERRRHRTASKGKARATFLIEDPILPSPIVLSAKYIPIACRFVPTDQWFTSHIDPKWSVKQTKQWLLSRCIPSVVTVPPTFRPSSPVTFSNNAESIRSSSSCSGSDSEDDDDDDYDSEYHNPNAETQSLLDIALLVESLPKEIQSRQLPPAPTSHSGNAGSAPPLKQFTLYSYSNGVLLDDSAPLAFYVVSPHSLLEIHKAGEYVYLPRGERERDLIRNEGEVVGYEKPWFCEEVAVREKGGGSGGEWRKRTVRIQDGWIEVLPVLGRVVGVGGQPFLRRICLDHMFEISDGGGAATGGEKIIVAHFSPSDVVGPDLWFSFPEGSRTFPHLLRILHRSHPDPATYLKTSFIDPLARMPTFARPHRSLESLLDDGEEVADEVHLDNAVRYPEWRRTVLERARKTGRGEKPAVLGTSVMQFWASMKEGVQLSSTQVDEMLREEGGGANADDDVQSENEWDLWASDIERQVPRMKSGMGGINFASGGDDSGLDFDDDTTTVGALTKTTTQTSYSSHSPPSSPYSARRTPPPVLLTKLSMSPPGGRGSVGAAFSPTSPSEFGHETWDPPLPPPPNSAIDIGHSPHPTLRHHASESGTSTSPNTKSPSAIFEALLHRPRSDNQLGGGGGGSSGSGDLPLIVDNKKKKKKKSNNIATRMKGVGGGLKDRFNKGLDDALDFVDGK